MAMGQVDLEMSDDPRAVGRAPMASAESHPPGVNRDRRPSSVSPDTTVTCAGYGVAVADLGSGTRDVVRC